MTVTEAAELAAGQATSQAETNPAKEGAAKHGKE
jgi:hypothetical protein